MKNLRRIFSALFILIAHFSLIADRRSLGNAQPRVYRVFVGTYTTKTTSKGIYAFDFDAATGMLKAKGIAAETPDPSWVIVHPNGKFAYAANEAGKASTVSAFSLDVKNGKLTLLNRLPSQGEDPCHMSFDKTGKYLFVANYSSGNVVVFPIGADGKLGAAATNVHDEGALGPNKERQEGPHAHWIEPSPDNRYVIVSDLGIDEILVYPFDANSGAFKRDGYEKVLHFNVAAGSGPRHLAFSADERWVFSVSELSSTLTWFLYDALRGGLTEVTTATMLPKHFKGRNDAAEIAIHHNGKWLYASNRGHDTIAVFSVDPATGKLKPAGDYSTGGKEPRHFAIDPSGKYLLAENQFSNNIVIFKIDPKTGALAPTGQVVEVPSPVDLTFVAAE